MKNSFIRISASLILLFNALSGPQTLANSADLAVASDPRSWFLDLGLSTTSFAGRGSIGAELGAYLPVINSTTLAGLFLESQSFDQLDSRDFDHKAVQLGLSAPRIGGDRSVYTALMVKLLL